MAVLLRVIAVVIGLLVLVPFLFLAWHLGEISLVQSTAARTIAGLLILGALLGFVALGVFAMVRLWQLRHWGRRAAAVIFALLLAIQVVATVSGVPGPTAGLLISASALLVLLLPSARAACR